MKTTVIGAGAMGSGIAQILAQAGYSVAVYDTKEEMLEKAKTKLKSTFDALVAKGKFTKEDAQNIIERIHFTGHLRDAEGSELAIEAIYENADAKRSVFRILDDLLPKDAVLATNTSSLSIASLASGIQHPERVIGLHFFNPAPVMPLVEIVPCLATSPSVVARCEAWVKEWGKVGVVAKDTPGFIVNRIARPFYGEALHLLEEQLADVATIDWALTEIGGFKMGPFALMDLIGNDVNYAVTETVWKQFYYDPRFRPSLTQKRLVEAGWLGKKTGRGFYAYGEGAPVAAPTKDLALAEIIVRRVVAQLVNEAYDALYRGIATADDIDIALQKGVNYPKGLFLWGKEIGLKNIVHSLDKTLQETGDMRYRVNPLLRKEAGI